MTLRPSLRNHTELKAASLLKFLLICLLLFLLQTKQVFGLFGNDYPWQSAQPTGAAYSWQMPGDGDIYSPLRFAYRNCTDWAAWRLNKARGGSTQDLRFTWSSLAFPSGDGNARGWRAGALNSGFAADSNPTVGSVAWWDGSVGGGYGHVAIVAEVHDGGNRIVLEDYNYHGTGVYTARNVTRSSGWPHAFLHIADVNPAPTPPPNRSIGGPTFLGGESLGTEQSLPADHYLLSADVRFALVLQSDGNLVLYGQGGQPLWATHTGGSGANRLSMQADGNLVLYTTDNRAVWSSNVADHAGSSLVVQGDGNLVTYDQAGRVTWHAATNRDGGMQQAYSGQIDPNQSLGQSQYLRSSDKRYALLLQPDGNLVLYGPAYHVLWSKATGQAGQRLIMQDDGNLVLYAANNQPIWNSQTGGNPQAFLKLQDDGNLVVYSLSSGPLWHSATNGRL